MYIGFKECSLAPLVVSLLGSTFSAIYILLTFNLIVYNKTLELEFILEFIIIPARWSTVISKYCNTWHKYKHRKNVQHGKIP